MFFCWLTENVLSINELYIAYVMFFKYLRSYALYAECCFVVNGFNFSRFTDTLLKLLYYCIFNTQCTFSIYLWCKMFN